MTTNTVRMPEAELMEFVNDPTTSDEARSQAWHRLRALARRPTASVAVCNAESELGSEILARRQAAPKG
jgi:hypothetical protein